MSPVSLMRRFSTILCLLILSGILLAGCTSTSEKPSYKVDNTGRLSVSCPGTTVSEEVMSRNDIFTKIRVVHATTDDGKVITYLSAPETPLGAVVYVPGAGETAAGHDEQMVRYAQAGYAFLYVDVRGNFGETDGLPFGQQLIQADYAKFKAGEWPQYYLTICDLSSARNYLADRFHAPVYIIGSSNGGRYAATAAAVDPGFAGYVGISTSDWGIYDAFVRQGYNGDPLRFAASLEPSTAIGAISPRPVWMFHAKADSVIPYETGEELFAHAGEPKTFIPFNGSHGIDPGVDARILQEWAQIYGTRG